jgi:hypothetical protein
MAGPFGFYGRNSGAWEPVSLLGHPRSAQPGKIACLDQGTDPGYSPIFDGPEPGDAGVTVIADERARFGKFDGSSFHIIIKSIAGSKE